MVARRLVMAAGPSELGDQVQAFVAESLGRPVSRFGYDDCRRQLSWNRRGVLILVAAGPEDWKPLADLARETAVRQSPLTIVVVHPAGSEGADELNRLAPLAPAALSWPAGADSLAELVRSAPADTGRTAHDLTEQLSSLTPSLAPLADRLATAAAHDLTVLLTGETGTGKTHLARLLHDHSPRRNQPFLMVPCGAQSSTLFESCFFGHVKGAFTNAHQNQQGKFAAAGKGTILLDEIETLTLDQQASLLRVIETGEYEPVGGHVTCRSEARVVVASNCDLEEAVERGKLRQDLFYRINVLSFHLPSLRRRPQDIGPLARSFAAQFSTRFGRELVGISADAMAALEAYDWPGNIRQLEHTVQQAVLMGRGPELAVDELPEAVRRGPSASPAGHPTSTSEPDRAIGPARGVRTDPQPVGGDSLLRRRADYERHVILKKLEECNFNRSSAARALGVSRVTLHKKIKQYGLADLR
jgi:DNA-binding NtrC family response regulator